MDINTWLLKFENSWKIKDINGIVNLFDGSIEYWETPFKKVSSIVELENEWKVIKNQDNISVSTTVVSSQDDMYTIKWNLAYEKENKDHVWSGVYLITLNEVGKCTYFMQVGEEK